MRQLSGSTPFAVLLCYTKGTNKPQIKTKGYYEDLFVNDPQGLGAYWRDVSHSHINLNGTRVFDWRELPNKNSEWDVFPRDKKIRTAVELFAQAASPADKVDFRPYYGVVVVVDRGGGGEIGSVGNGQMHFQLDGVDLDLGVVICSEGNGLSHIAHEIGHAFGFDHSFDISPAAIDPANDNRPGAYGDGWDIMSSNLGFAYMHQRFFHSGPILNAVNMELAGWLDSSRVRTIPHLTAADFFSPITVDLQALNSPNGTGKVVLKFDTVYFEFRTNDSWDAGIGQPCVLVHKQDFNVEWHSVLLRNDANRHEYFVGDNFESGSTRINISRFDLANRVASLTCSFKPSPTPSRPDPCGMFKDMIRITTQRISQLRRQLQQATSEEEKERLRQELDAEVAQLGALHDESVARGCP